MLSYKYDDYTAVLVFLEMLVLRRSKVINFLTLYLINNQLIYKLITFIIQNRAT